MYRDRIFNISSGKVFSRIIGSLTCLCLLTGAQVGMGADTSEAQSTRRKPGMLQKSDLKAKGKFGSASNKKEPFATAAPKNEPGTPPGGRGARGNASFTPSDRTIPTETNADSGWSDVKQAQSLDVGIEYKKPRRGERFTFNLVDADLIELIKIIGNITGKSFILGGKVPKLKATIYAPVKITANEAYRAFLSVLQVNGLTVIPSGRYLKVVSVGGATAQNTPILNQAPGRDQIITHLHRLDHVSADELSGLLDRFKSADGDITVYSPTNTLIITDYGTAINRLLKLVRLLDVPGTGEQIWVEPINYASADELASRITEIFDFDGGKKSTTNRASTPAKKKRKKSTGPSAFGEVDDSTKLSKIIADDRTNSLIIIASEDAYLRILELIKVLDVPIAGEGTLHVHKLQHSDAEELSKTLSNLSKRQGGSSKKAKGTDGSSLFEGEMQISADKATNSLVIVSSLRDYMSLKTVIDTLDTMQRQVFVEAVIMEVSLDKNKELGIGLHGGGLVGPGGDESLVYGMSQLPGGPNSLFLDPSALTGLAAGVTGPEIPGSQDLVGVSIPAFGVALQAMQQNTDVNVLSTPHILATDNVEASITVGENVPVLQGVNSGAALLGGLTAGSSGSSVNNLLTNSTLGGMMSSYSRQDVGITLKITPHINDDNQVRLEVDLEISEVKSIDPTSGPTISKQNANTTSVVADQQTFVLGGLITDNQVQTTTKVPVLGDIPLIGVLFRHRSSMTKKRNLLIFLTPYIIRNAEDFREIFERKMAERREFIERYTAFEYHRYDPHLDWSRTQGVISVVEHVVGTAEEDAKLRALSEIENTILHTPKKPIDLSHTSSSDEAAATGVQPQALGAVPVPERDAAVDAGGDGE